MSEHPTAETACQRAHEHRTAVFQKAIDAAFERVADATKSGECHTTILVEGVARKPVKDALRARGYRVWKHACSDTLHLVRWNKPPTTPWGWLQEMREDFTSRANPSWVILGFVAVLVAITFALPAKR